MRRMSAFEVAAVLVVLVAGSAVAQPSGGSTVCLFEGRGFVCPLSNGTCCKEWASCCPMGFECTGTKAQPTCSRAAVIVQQQPNSTNSSTTTAAAKPADAVESASQKQREAADLAKILAAESSGALPVTAQADPNASGQQTLRVRQNDQVAADPSRPVRVRRVKKRGGTGGMAVVLHNSNQLAHSESELSGLDKARRRKRANKRRALKKMLQKLKRRLKGTLVVKGPVKPIQNTVVANAMSMPRGPVRSYAFWIRADGITPGWSNVFHFGGTDNSRNPAVWLYPGNMQLHLRDGTPQDWNEGFPDELKLPALKPRVWTHVAVTHVGGVVRVFFNGRKLLERKGAADMITPAPNAPVYFSDPWYPAALAAVRDLRLYHGRGLTPMDVQFLYRGQKEWPKMLKAIMRKKKVEVMSSSRSGNKVRTEDRSEGSRGRMRRSEESSGRSDRRMRRSEESSGPGSYVRKLELSAPKIGSGVKGKSTQRKQRR